MHAPDPAATFWAAAEEEEEAAAAAPGVTVSKACGAMAGSEMAVGVLGSCGTSGGCEGVEVAAGEGPGPTLERAVLEAGDWARRTQLRYCARRRVRSMSAQSSANSSSGVRTCKRTWQQTAQ